MVIVYYCPNGKTLGAFVDLSSGEGIFHLGEHSFYSRVCRNANAFRCCLFYTIEEGAGRLVDIPDEDWARSFDGVEFDIDPRAAFETLMRHL